MQLILACLLADTGVLVYRRGPWKKPGGGWRRKGYSKILFQMVWIRGSNEKIEIKLLRRAMRALSGRIKLPQAVNLKPV